ncbi:MAG: ABC transporter ATP-binding protein [Planctomycetia bacterium]|nr:ABC transporter ATP-binding protein [Planctomycetia bacterium]
MNEPMPERVAPVNPPPPAAPGSLPERPPAVEFLDVTKIYGRGTPREYVAVSHVSFTIPDVVGHGEISSFLGPSGCGKSTVLRLVAGLEPQHPPTSGSVTVLGRPVVGPGADRGMVFQDYTSFDHRTVLDNVVFGLECRGMPRREREAEGTEWIAKVGLDPGRDARKYPHELSGGMRQRVAIARTLILRPRIILMDEPFGALDPATRLDMQDLLVKLWREVEATVLFVTHSVEEAVFLGDRVFVMATTPGRIAEEIRMPAPTAPARDTQSQPWFHEQVNALHARVERIEAEARRVNGAVA